MLAQFPVIAELSRKFAQSEAAGPVKFYKFGAAPPPYIMQFRKGRCDEDVILASRFDRFAAAKLGALEDLEKWLPGTLDSLIAPAAREACRTGEFREVPYLGEVMVLNFNRQLLAAAGIQTPATNWRELEEHAGILLAATPRVTPLALVLNADSEVYFYYPMLLGLAGTCAETDGWPLTDGLAVTEALNSLRRWREKGLCNGVGADAFSLFRSGDAAYFISWASHGTMAAASLGDANVGFVPLPGPAYISFHRGVVPKGRPHAGMAARYLSEVLLSDEMQRAVFAAGKIGVRKADFFEAEDLPPSVRPLREHLENGSSGPTAPFNLDKLNLAIHKAVQGVATGQLTTGEAISDMTSTRDAERKATQP